MNHRMIFLALWLWLAGEWATAQNLQTFFEKSGGFETPRYAETIGFCRQLDSLSEQVVFTSFGKSPQGRDLPLLIFDRDGYQDPGKIRAAGRIILMVQACIHPGESEGKDAGLLLFRDLIAKKAAYEWTDKVSILFIPIFNVDGHERFGPYNRINQNGPLEMGWRTTAQNLNLNRDYVKAVAPEMQAWLALYHVWLPEFFVDCHTTDGADYQYVLTYAMETHGSMDQGLTQWQTHRFLPIMRRGMEKAGYPIFPYVTFRNWHDPRSGLQSGVSPPMLSQGYTALLNRPGLLIETHMLKPYKQRVEGTLAMIRQTMAILQDEKDRLVNLMSAADERCRRGYYSEHPAPMGFELETKDSTMVDFLGVEYRIDKSDLTGGDWFKYSDKPATFRIPFFDSLRPTHTVLLPKAYVIPGEWEEVIKRLDWHGIEYRRLDKPQTMRVKSWKLKNPKWKEKPYEGRHTLTVETDESEGERLFPAGSVLIPTNQLRARLIAHLLEPGQGSMLFWGFFDAILEQKEYAETYVMEPKAREMIRENPSLLQEFKEWKTAHPEVEADSWAQLNWFYAKTPYFDQAVNLYPVARLLP